MVNAARDKYDALLQQFKSMQRVAVAFSGGQDSTLLLVLAQEVLGDNVVAFTVNSPYMASWEIDEARALTKRYSIQHQILEVPIIDSIKSNPPDRCYLCKHNIFARLKQEADKLGIKYVIDGTNSDDVRSYRPGIKALQELGISSPLLENNISKQDIRDISKELGLSTWNKPAYACLLSRIPYNESIDLKLLKRIDKSEKLLIELGFNLVRVRAHQDLARIEVPVPDIQRLLQPELREKIDQAFTQFGFKYVTIDARGYRSGCYDESESGAR